MLEKRAVFWSRKMVLTREQRIFVVKNNFCNELRSLCRKAFQEAFPNDTVLNKTIYRIITKFEETGSVCDRKHRRRTQCKTRGVVCCSPLLNHCESCPKKQNMCLGGAHQTVHLLHQRGYRIHRCTSWLQRACGPLGLLTYLHQISFCGVISKAMSTTGIVST
jgi:hypothetical protein